MTFRFANISVILGTLALATIPFGCERPASDAPAAETADADVVSMDEARELREELSNDWQGLRDRVTEFQKKVTEDGVDNESDRTAERLDQEAAQLRKEVDEFRGSTQQAWDDFEARVHSGIERLGAEVDAATEQLN